MTYEAYNIFDLYTTNKAIQSKGANSIAFENKGDVTARINNNYRLRPGEILEISQVLPTVTDKTQYAVSFDLADAATTGVTQELVVITTFCTPVEASKANGLNCEKL